MSGKFTVSPKIEAYIAEHSFCSEYLFRDWESFLDVLYSEGGRVAAILWWDHCKKSMQNTSVGGGGYRDPENSEYLYAETQYYEDGLETKTLGEIKKLIRERRAAGFILGDKYFSYDLVPSFYLAE